MGRSSPLNLILRPGLGDRLPLHVRRGVFAALRQRNDVIDHVAWTTLRIPALLHEVALRYFAALDLAVSVAGAALALRRGRLSVRELALRLALVADRWRACLRRARLRRDPARCRVRVRMDAARTSTPRTPGRMTTSTVLAARRVATAAMASTVTAAATSRAGE